MHKALVTRLRILLSADPTGIPLREYNMLLQDTSHGDVRSATLPSHFPLLLPQNPSCIEARTRGQGRLTSSEKSDLIARVGRESLRALAHEYGVSHETIRRVAAHGHQTT